MIFLAGGERLPACDDMMGRDSDGLVCWVFYRAPIEKNFFKKFPGGD